MTTEGCGSATTVAVGHHPDKRPRSIFELPGDFFDSCRLIPPGKHHSPPPPLQLQSSSAVASASSSAADVEETLDSSGTENIEELNAAAIATTNKKSRLTCNTCKAEFESLIEQRSHFKSDFHRFNVKLSLAGKSTVKEEDFDELTSESLSKDFDVSSISGSEDDDDSESHLENTVKEALVRSIRQKILVRLSSGEQVSLWKCLLLKDSQTMSHENDQFLVSDDNGQGPCLRETDMIEMLKVLIREPRDNTHLRVMLMAKGGHFAGCVFDGNKVVAHKTFHRYVVRAKAGGRQSSKDAKGRPIHSAGASLRRYNELALKKDIQELLTSWKPYFDASSCVFIHAPSSNRQMFYNGEKLLFGDWCSDTRNIPFTVRRPTFKEAQRIYGQLTQIVFQVDEKEFADIQKLELNESCTNKEKPEEESKKEEANPGKATEACERDKISDEHTTSGESDEEVVRSTTPLHEAAKSANAEKVLELLEQGLDPTIKDERGRTPYTLATEKEVRNIFRRFMASNLEKWDWNAANVPSALTKEMEESQAARQAEKDAKRKAKAKELKKLRKAREKKKAQAQAAESQNVTAAPMNKPVASPSVREILAGAPVRLSKEEELKRKQAEEREKRAAAAERRIALAAAAAAASSSSPGTTSSATPSVLQTKVGVNAGVSSDNICSCCSASLAGKVPFHRYNYRYCSTTCMHVHRESLEDG